MLPLRKDSTFTINIRGELQLSGPCTSHWMPIEESYDAVRIGEVQKRTGLSATVIKQLAAKGDLPIITAGNATRYLVPRLQCSACNPVEQWDITKVARFMANPDREDV